MTARVLGEIKNVDMLVILIGVRFDGLIVAVFVFVTARVNVVDIYSRVGLKDIFVHIVIVMTYSSTKQASCMRYCNRKENRSPHP